MRICVVGKYPPVEGGVSAQTYWTSHILARAGHSVFVVTNADEVEPEHRLWFLPGDLARLEADYPGGGTVRVTYTQPRHDDDLYYIPHGKPTITRLASVAVEVVRQHDCDLLIGWYLEPYLIATCLVAAWTHRPYLVRHAGSDAFELAAQSELGPAYREAIRASAGMLGSGMPADGLGLPEAKVFTYPGLSMPAEFAATGPVLDLAEAGRLLRESGWVAVLPAREVPPGTKLIGAYGKLGVAKGTLDLVRATAAARAAGHEVGLALVGGGRGWKAVIDEAGAAGLADVTLAMPMLAPWRIPSFIRACHAVAFLERDFGVSQHQPVPPVEVLACGRPLLLSAQMLPKALPGCRADDPLLRAVEVVDPHDAKALADAVGLVLSRQGPAAHQVAPSLRDEAEIAAWYAEVFDQVTTEHASVRTGYRPPAPGLAPAAEALLTARCPALVHVCGQQVFERHRAAMKAAPNALTAAYAVADSALPEVRAALGDADDSRRAMAKLGVAEQLALWTRVDVESQAGIAAFPLPVRRVRLPLPADMPLGELFPVASNWLRIAEFDLDALAHLQAVASGHSAGAAISLPAPARQVLLFHKTPNLRATISPIGPGIRALLEAADGTISLREHAARLGVEGDRLARFLAAVSDLHARGVLFFRRDLGDPGSWVRLSWNEFR